MSRADFCAAPIPNQKGRLPIDGLISREGAAWLQPPRAVVSKRHFHDVDVQMIYVLKGWIKSEFEGQGEVTLPPDPVTLQLDSRARSV
jgi:hypothetical protein